MITMDITLVIQMVNMFVSDVLLNAIIYKPVPRYCGIVQPVSGNA